MQCGVMAAQKVGVCSRCALCVQKGRAGTQGATHMAHTGRTTAGHQRLNTAAVSLGCRSML